MSRAGFQTRHEMPSRARGEILNIEKQRAKAISKLIVEISLSRVFIRLYERNTPQRKKKKSHLHKQKLLDKVINFAYL